MQASKYASHEDGKNMSLQKNYKLIPNSITLQVTF